MIRIICGVYGHYINGRVIAKDKNSDPFELTPEREAELVAHGIAAYVDDGSPIGFDETPPEPTDVSDGVAQVHEYSTSNSVKELREIAKQCGLNFKVGMSKVEMVAALDAFFDSNMTDDEPDDDDAAPTFDAAEAVQE